MDLEQCPILDKPSMIRTKYPKSNTSYQTQDYFYQKPIDSNLICMDAVCVSDSVNYEENTIVINEIKEKIGIFSSREVRQREASMVGFEIFSKGEKVTEFEWDSKSYNNLVVAIFQRHLSSRTTPCPMVVE